MATELPRPTFIFELANNHMGDVSHGVSVIEEFGVLKQEYPQFTFTFKLHRDLRPLFIRIRKAEGYKVCETIRGDRTLFCGL